MLKTMLAVLIRRPSNESRCRLAASRGFGCIGLILTFALCATAAKAQQREKVPRVGMLFIGGHNQPHLKSFKEGLHERGYNEGKNINLIYKYAEGKQDRLPTLAAEFVRDHVDVIVTTASMSALAARRVTRMIPIVMTSGNPLAAGLAASLAKPAGNVTGLTVMLADMSGKRLEILKDALPKMTSVAALWRPQDNEAAMGYKETRLAAKAIALKVQSIEVQTADDLDRAFGKIVKAQDDGLVVILSPLVTLHSRRIVELALQHRVPGIYPTRQFGEEGGLMAYGPLIGDLYRRAAAYVDKILRGAKPAELPIEQPTKFEFIVNLKSAKRIGVIIPPNVLARANRVIR